MADYPKFRYQHLKSATQGAVPSVGTLKKGEIGVNYYAGEEKLFIENSADQVVAFITSGAVTTLINNASTAITTDLSELSGKVETNITNISTISSTTIPAIEGEIQYISGEVSSNDSDIEYISGQVASNDADIEYISGQVASNDADISYISGVVNTVTATTIPAIEGEIQYVSGVVNSVSGDVETLKSNKFGGVEYVSTGDTHIIYFYDNSTDKHVLGQVNADDFIKDGMVDTVTVETKSGSTYLVVTWNTDAGKSVTELNIGDIFDADNYYTKSDTSGATEIQNALDLKADESDLNTLSGTVTGHTADTTIHVTSADKTLWNNAITGITVNDSPVTVTNNVAALEDIASAQDLSDLETAFNTHSADSSLHFSGVEKANLDSLATNIATISGIDSSDVALWDAAITAVSVNGSALTVNDNAVALTDVASDSELSSLNDVVTAHTANNDIHLTPTEKTNIDAISGNVSTLSAITASAAAINSLTGAVGTMAFQDANSYSSATEVSTALGGKQDTLSDDQLTGNIKTVVGKSLLGTGNVPINIVELSDITTEGTAPNQTVIFDAGTF